MWGASHHLMIACKYGAAVVGHKRHTWNEQTRVDRRGYGHTDRAGRMFLNGLETILPNNYLSGRTLS
jgi:hypothetical protein